MMNREWCPVNVGLVTENWKRESGNGYWRL